MRILIIGTGADIPPTGWGAVEAIIWEHINWLPKLGVEVDLLNTLDWGGIGWQAKQLNKEYDFVHFHYDIQWPYAKAMSPEHLVAMSSHFPYLGNEEMYAGYGYWKVMRYFLDEQHDNLNFCISDKDIAYFKAKGVPENKLFRLKLGASEDLCFTNTPNKPERSIYLGKVSQRKRQATYGQVDFMDFAGNLEEGFMVSCLKNYLGEWSRETVKNELTNYGNLVLLSHGENTPLVIREALIAGLGVVCSESCVEELDTNLPFITVIPNSRLNDLPYVIDEIHKNRAVSLPMREEIRHYGCETFGWSGCTKHYISEIERAVNSRR